MVFFWSEKLLDSYSYGVRESVSCMRGYEMLWIRPVFQYRPPRYSTVGRAELAILGNWVIDLTHVHVQLVVQLVIGVIAYRKGLTIHPCYSNSW